jgi:hypothetical protein
MKICVNCSCFITMQILQGGTMLKKFHLTHFGLLKEEMEELKNLMKHTPILPNIVSIQWCVDDERAYEYVNWDYKQHKSLLETLRHTFPHAKVLG